MDSKPCDDSLGGALTEEDSASLVAWLTTVVLVLIVICAALWLGAWREHKKKSQAAGAQTTTINCKSNFYSVLSYAERSFFVFAGASRDEFLRWDWKSGRRPGGRTVVLAHADVTPHELAVEKRAHAIRPPRRL